MTVLFRSLIMKDTNYLSVKTAYLEKVKQFFVKVRRSITIHLVLLRVFTLLIRLLIKVIFHREVLEYVNNLQPKKIKIKKSKVDKRRSKN